MNRTSRPATARHAAATLVAAVTVVLVGACGVTVAGQGSAVSSPGAVVNSPGHDTTADPDDTTTSPRDPETCDNVIYSDPTIAFEPQMEAGTATLMVGKTTWLAGQIASSGVTVSGPDGVIQLTDMSVATQIRCGQSFGSVEWIEVKALAPGTVTITIPAGASAKQSQTTVVVVNSR